MRRQYSALLLWNGLILGSVATLQFGFDLAGYWAGIGPTGHALHGNLDTIGYVEAHGLAAIFSLLLILRRKDSFAGWHAAAAGVHLLLGTCNVMFWPLFAAWSLEPMGYMATAMHAIFAGLELWAFLCGGLSQAHPIARATS